LFDNRERAEIGTLYKQVSRDAAVLRGLELVGPKLAYFVRTARELAPDGGEVLVHCWRGGMRSGSMAWLLETAGIPTATLQGGYKAYRQAVLQEFEKPLNLLVLGGKTGSGKTDVLHELARRGEQVLDLERLAHHRGSSYGMLGQPSQPSVEQFENLLFEEIRTLKPTRRIWVEDESRKVGTCVLPEGFWRQFLAAPVLALEVPLEARVQFLVKTYGQFPREELRAATERIRKRLGNDRHQLALDALDRGDYAEVVRLTLAYYDKAYQHALSQREPAKVSTIEAEGIDPAGNAAALLSTLSS
jgi:tRNA 2-selenouridine synthase